MKVPTLISAPEQATAAWLTDVLQYAGYHATVNSVTTREIGTGQMSRTFVFTLDRHGDDSAPVSIVGKFNSSDPATLKLAEELGTYTNEVGFYSDLATKLPISVPHCYFAKIDPNKTDFVLLLEDMSPACQGDQMEGFSLPIARAAIEELAKLHTSTWCDPSLKSYGWLRALIDLQEDCYISQQEVTAEFVQRYSRHLEPEIINIVERMADNYHNLISCLTEQPTALIHWDYRADNILVNKQLQPPAVCAVDWQVVQIGAPLQDVGYFIGASLRTRLRRENEPVLVKEYYNSLLDKGIKDYSWEQCWRGYQLGSFSGLTMAIRASILVEETERGNEMFATMARRHGRQILDVGADKLL